MFETREINGRSAVQSVDEGLRQYMNKVFNYMCLGLLLTALTAYLGTQEPLLSLIYNFNPATRSVSLSIFGWIISFAPFIMIIAFAPVIRMSSAANVQLMFWGFSGIMGLSLSSVGLMYTGESIMKVFLITSAMFGSMSILGYTTKKDLSNIGSVLYMAVIGMIIASIVNLFVGSSTLSYILSYIAVAVFTGLTAFDVQKIKNMYYASSGNTEFANKTAIMGALSIYIDFINLFLSLMNISGERK